MNILYLELTNRDLFDPRVAPDSLQRGMISWQKHNLNSVECIGGVYRKNEVVLYHRNKERMKSFRLTHAQFDYWVKKSYAYPTSSNDGYASSTYYDLHSYSNPVSPLSTKEISIEFSVSLSKWNDDMKSIFEALKVITK